MRRGPVTDTSAVSCPDPSRLSNWAEICSRVSSDGASRSRFARKRLGWSLALPVPFCGDEHAQVSPKASLAEPRTLGLPDLGSDGASRSHFLDQAARTKPRAPDLLGKKLGRSLALPVP
jgi:hypothetical protein